MTTRPDTGGPDLVDRLLAFDVPGAGGHMHVVAEGPGGAPVVLLLHGFSGSLRWWDRAAALLADRFRIVRVDLLGHGGTGGPAADAPIQARAVAAVLDQLALTEVTAVGHSFGADVAVELAETCARVNRLMIVTQAPDYSDATLPRGRAVMTVPVLDRALHRGALGLGRGLNAVVSRSARRGPDPVLAAQALRDFGALTTGMFRVVLVDRRDRMARRPLDAQVRTAGKPTLVLLGGRDHFYGTRSAGRYTAAGARVEVLPDAGHSVQVEQPRIVAELIAAFATGRDEPS